MLDRISGGRVRKGLENRKRSIQEARETAMVHSSTSVRRNAAVT